MRVILLLASLLVAALSHAEQKLLTNDNHPSGWYLEIRETAVRSYVYAQIAKNVYEDQPYFVLPENVSLLKIHQNDHTGLAYSVYAIRTTADAPEIVVAFRGTENLKDIFYGSFLSPQRREAVRQFALVKEQYKGSRFVTVGHSLGGALAMQVAAQPANADVSVYMFNHSPLRTPAPTLEGRTIESVVEYGDFLKILRAPAADSANKYTSIGCSSANRLGDHSMYALAVCLTQIAATESMEARESLTMNHLPRRFAWHTSLPTSEPQN